MNTKWRNRKLNLGLFVLLIALPTLAIGQKGTVILTKDNLTVQQVFDQIVDRNGGLNFIYSDLGKELTVRLKHKGSAQAQPIKELLDLIAQQTRLRFTVNGNDIIVRIAAEGRESNNFFTLSGTVKQKDPDLSLGYANVLLQSIRTKDRKYSTVAGSDGRFYFQSIPKDEYILSATFVGYRSLNQNISLKSSANTVLLMETEFQQVNEINVTATEQKGMTTSSVIKRDAIDHMQATSLTDLMSLLPGGRSSPPALASPNLLRIREASPPASKEYAISSLGTLFVIDGIPMSMDANRQSIDQTSNLVHVSSKEYADFGMDMRGITTDNIESIEVIRGIPSVRYGDLTSGVVKIERLQEAQPWTARFKLDQFSKMLTLSKGVALKKNWLLNADINYLDGKRTPINPLETYDRYTVSLRTEKRWGDKAVREIKWNTSIDYSGQFDDWKIDREQMLDQETYRLTYQSGRLASRLSMKQPNHLLHTLEFDINANYSIDNIYRERWPSNDQERGIVPLSMEEGVSEAILLPKSYLAKIEVDGRPFNGFATLRGMMDFNTLGLQHKTQLGLEWRMDKNYGAGQIFDIARPVSNGFGLRPYRYDRVPAMQQASYFIEDHIKSPKWYGNQLNLQLGIRGGTMFNLDKAYVLQGKFYADPRINAQWELPAIDVFDKPLRLTWTGGIGWLTKMPTMNMLYPDIVYQDFIEFKHTNLKPELSYYQLRTYIEDRVNYDLSYTRNKKKELRLDAEWAGHYFSVTWFDEVLNNGFRPFLEPKTYAYNFYGLLNQPQYASKPDLSTMPYTERKIFRGNTYQSNGTTLTKSGLEFTFTTPRYPGINTRFTVTGAYFKNNYQNSQAMWFLGNARNNPSVGDFVVFDHYAALYPDWRDGYYRKRKSANVTADTYIKRYGLTLSLTAELYLHGENLIWENRPGYPSYYLTTDNVLHPYTEADKKDVYRQFLFYPDGGGGLVTDNKFQMKGHFRGSKDFGEWLRLSLFILNFGDINPGFDNARGVYQKNANSAAYFGMELRFKF
ncbi:MAG: TonB-dependent receptor plug domain-containing protein [Sphingobacterium sp.]|jgi:hypothetical protein|nr:TonB-dependent receptor plug domain-containing protein [Sphingobacterium sp.]